MGHANERRARSTLGKRLFAGPRPGAVGPVAVARGPRSMPGVGSTGSTSRAGRVRDNGAVRRRGAKRARTGATEVSPRACESADLLSHLGARSNTDLPSKVCR